MSCILVLLKRHCCKLFTKYDVASIHGYIWQFHSITFLYMSHILLVPFCDTVTFSGFRLCIYRSLSYVTLLNAIQCISSYQWLGADCVVFISTMTFQNVALCDTCIVLLATHYHGIFVTNMDVHNTSFFVVHMEEHNFCLCCLPMSGSSNCTHIMDVINDLLFPCCISFIQHWALFNSP